MRALPPSILHRSGFATLALAAALLPASCASDHAGISGARSSNSGEVARWSQERVTALAAELVLAADEVQDQLRNQEQPTTGHAAAFYRLKESVRRARREARHFSAALEAGRGQAETLPIFEGLDELVNDAAENSRKIMMQAPLLDAVVKAGGVVNRIRPYYDPRSFERP